MSTKSTRSFCQKLVWQKKFRWQLFAIFLEIKKQSSLQKIGGLCDECHVKCYRVGCLSLQMSVKSYVSRISVIFCMQRLCVSSLPFFLSRCISRTVLKSPPIINFLSSCVLMYNSRISNISISSLLGPYMLRIVTNFSCIFISSACNRPLTSSV